MKNKRSGDLIFTIANPATSEAVKFQSMMELRNRLDEYKKLVYKKSDSPKQYTNLQKLRKSKKCMFCGSGSGLTVDHIKPKSKGGANTIDNVQTLCAVCNSNKADSYPYTKKDAERDRKAQIEEPKKK